jgi:hypothetical protein
VNQGACAHEQRRAIGGKTDHRTRIAVASKADAERRGEPDQQEGPDHPHDVADDDPPVSRRHFVHKDADRAVGVGVASRVDGEETGTDQKDGDDAAPPPDPLDAS